ncbi:HalOD1 output domain-containing protein [Halorussus litoreus]|uniref:HalOD1 output domain-containing protein n=1 Tax=Halorussus litoreus TaxID=1710536 RepID=UPI00130076CF|nr:HalOD1 output domain-containing protein [Halorussus litoreus]
MSSSRTTIEPVEIRTDSDGGGPTATYVFDVSGYMLDGEVCTGIALGLSEVVGHEPPRLTPLSAVVDCDALETLFKPRRYGDLRDEVSVSFPYDVYEVTVHSSGRVVMRR